MADPSDYALQLSAGELARYRMMAQGAREAEAYLWQQAGIVDGAVVADVGCGPAAMFPALVESVGASGSVIGVDGAPTAVAQAQQMITAAGWTNATAQVGQATHTGLEPASVDVAMMRHVLAHNGPTEQDIVDHLATVVSPGGCVYLADILGGALRIRPSDPVAEEIDDSYRRFHASLGNDLQTGLRLDELLTTAGLDVIAYRGWFTIITPPPGSGIRPPAWSARDAMVAAGFVTAEDLARWEQALDALAERRPTVFAPVFVAVGRRTA